MNITFLIGNGFDLNLGMKTGYPDFYEYYIKHKASDGFIKDSITEERNKKEYKRWSDLELGLGDVLSQISESGISDFIDQKAKMEEILAEYLSRENSRFVITDEGQAGLEFRDKILAFRDEFTEVDTDYLDTVRNQTNETIFYRFVTFNYTMALDHLVEASLKNANPFSTHTYKSSVYNDRVCSPLHIHGSFYEGMILALDNTDQIKNPELQNNTILERYMTKQSQNRIAKQNRFKKFKEIIDNSTFVFLYGLSLGDTDATYWKYLVNWLADSKTRRLVLCCYHPQGSSKTSTNAMIYADRERHRLWKKITGKTIGELDAAFEDQVIVIENTKIFDYSFKLKGDVDIE